MEKGRLIVAGFATLATFAMAVAVLSVLIPDWRAYLVLTFPAVVVTANRLMAVSLEEIDLDELSDTELLVMAVAHLVAMFTSWIVPLVYVYSDGVYYFFIATLTLYITILSSSD